MLHFSEFQKSDQLGRCSEVSFPYRSGFWGNKPAPRGPNSKRTAGPSVHLGMLHRLNGAFVCLPSRPWDADLITPKCEREKTETSKRSPNWVPFETLYNAARTFIFLKCAYFVVFDEAQQDCDLKYTFELPLDAFSLQMNYMKPLCNRLNRFDGREGNGVVFFPRNS